MLPAILSLLSFGPDEPAAAEFVLNPPATVGTVWVYETKARRDAKDAAAGTPREFDYGGLRWTVTASADGVVSRTVETFRELPEDEDAEIDALRLSTATSDLSPSGSVDRVDGDTVAGAADPAANMPSRIEPDAETVVIGGRTHTVAERDRLTLVSAGQFRCLVLTSERTTEDGRTLRVEDRLASGVGLVKREVRLAREGRDEVLSGVELRTFDAAPLPPMTAEEIAALPKSLYPTAVGTRWVYRTFDSGLMPGEASTAGSYGVDVVDSGTFRGRPAWKLKTVFGSGGLLTGLLNRLAGQGEKPVYGWETYDADRSLYLMADVAEPDDPNLSVDSLEKSSVFAFWPPRKGAQYELDSETETVNSVRRETIVVPAGVFECVRVETDRDGQGPTVGWWASGVGLVRLTSFDEDGQETYREELVRFEAPGP